MSHVWNDINTVPSVIEFFSIKNTFLIAHDIFGEYIRNRISTTTISLRLRIACGVKRRSWDRLAVVYLRLASIYWNGKLDYDTYNL